MNSMDPIAVVGMGGVFPKAPDLSTFWHNIINRINATTDIPAARWIAPPAMMVAQEHQADKAFHRKACLVEDFQFNSAGLSIDSDLINHLDPLYQITLEAGRQAASGFSCDNIDSGRKGVVLAAIALPTQGASQFAQKVVGSSFETRIKTALTGKPFSIGGHFTKQDIVKGSVTALPASLLAAALGYGGKAFTLDAACASSLYAIKIACDELSSHRADMMLAGGVSRPDCLYTQVGFSQLRALSRSGRCSPFDRAADGLVVGEGAGIVALKRLDDAIVAGDAIHGVIRGIGLSNDLRGNLLSPDSEGQLRAMQRAYDISGWSVYDVDYIECHGAGTPLGDTTELKSLIALWNNIPTGSSRKINQCDTRCAIGSVKSMIGHLLTAAASAGLIKVLLGFSHRTLPPSIHYEKPPDNSPLLASPFCVQTAPEKWPNRNTNTPRRAAINAFGFGGINAHLLVEEYLEDQWVSQPVRQSDGGTVEQPASGSDKCIIKKHNRPAADLPIAIVGIGASFGTLKSLDQFVSAVLNGQPYLNHRSDVRWKGCDQMARETLGHRLALGGYIERLNIRPSDFRMPPSEFPDLLPQHLLMLQTTRDAINDALLDKMGINVGTVIGIDFDFEATNFHLRWALFETVRRLNNDYQLGLDEVALLNWRDQLADTLSPPLTHARTLGALGSMVASRLAREFQLGGPSFVVSSGAASGFEALEIAARSLQQHETDAMIVGAVDFSGDVRQTLLKTQLLSFSSGQGVTPFAPETEGTLTGEGAGAVIIKRLADALKDNDRIYAVVKGIGTAGGVMGYADSMQATYVTAVNKALNEAERDFYDLDLLELHASGDRFEDKIEKKAIDHLFKATKGRKDQRPAIGAIKPIIGHTGAAAAIASLIKTAICLYNGQAPPWPSNHMDTSKMGHPWSSIANQRSKRTLDHAGIASIASEGTCGFVVLSDHLQKQGKQTTAKKNAGAVASRRPIAPPITITVGGFLEKVPFPAGATAGPVPQPSPTRDVSVSRESGATLHLNAARHLVETTKETGKAHQRFLTMSAEMTRLVGDTLVFKNAFMNRHGLTSAHADKPLPNEQTDHELNQPTSCSTDAPIQSGPKPLFSRTQCMEFAVGLAAKVFGASFAVVDTYPTRVRLPDEPLMLVDRILSIEGKKGGLGTGRIVTEHDVLASSWYLDADRAPVCISVEAGQADLFLCAYLGIDFRVKGERTYRLLDATVTFHRGLPLPGEVIRYDIRIDKFIRRGDTYLFFFRFVGTIDDQPLITMTDGCAGFFTPAEVEKSGGIIESADEDSSSPEHGRGQWEPFFPVDVAAYGDDALEALRRGDPAECFGDQFREIHIPPNLLLPGGRLRLIHRITHLNPNGGRYGLGMVRAEADIAGDEWFLTCHFVDDMVMPGTLMYECCAHTLRVLLQRMGWVSELPTACYEPVPGIKSKLICRGPVTPNTQQVIYEVQITEIGYQPEPYVIGDAHMFADGRHIVRFHNISMKLSGVSLPDLKSFWKKRRPTTIKSDSAGNSYKAVRLPAVFNHAQLLSFAKGNPSDAFGEPYRDFDKERFIARLPSPPYLFIDNITKCDPLPWVLQPGGWAEAAFTTAPDDWFFHADRSGILPYAVCLEIALQPCGWLAAYMGSALLSEKDLRFRNLGGHGRIKKDIHVAKNKINTRVRLAQVSKAAGMIIETFEFQVKSTEGVIYQGDTYFGFFTEKALSRQEGINDNDRDGLLAGNSHDTATHTFKDTPPYSPAKSPSGEYRYPSRLSFPGKAIRMIDHIETFLPDGGPFHLGYIKGVKNVDPTEWFFAAHFYQDPVCPGSLGIESFLQLLKYYMINQFQSHTNGYSFSLISPQAHEWTYRGQILPTNKEVIVEAVITKLDQHPTPSIVADGWLGVDGRTIYHMKQFGLRLVPDHQG